MPLQLNLLHEEILEQRQRQRDPLKLSIYAGIGLAALLLLNYLWTGYRVLDSKRHLNGVQGEWAKVEPKVTAAQNRAEALNAIFCTTKTLDTLIDSRFLRSPLLQKVTHCVTPNIQITSLKCSVENDEGHTITLDGAAGRQEP